MLPLRVQEADGARQGVLSAGPRVLRADEPGHQIDRTFLQPLHSGSQLM